MFNQATLLRAHYATEKDAASPNWRLLHSVGTSLNFKTPWLHRRERQLQEPLVECL